MLTPAFALVSDRETCSPAAGVKAGPFWLWNRQPLLLRGKPCPSEWGLVANSVEVLPREPYAWPGTAPNPSRTAAVFCPGPSLRQWVTHGADTVLAVNAAADAVDPDWVVSSKREPPWAGSEGTFITTGSHPDRFAKPERDCVGTHPTTAAVALAAWLGHGVVTVYGDDRGGARHFDGSPSHDSPGRWLREGAAFDALVWNLAQVGCVVERVLP